MATNIRINGDNFNVDLSTLAPDITLNTFLRDHAQLTATKFMCLEGGCGACIVAVRREHPVTGAMETFSVNSCLTLLNVCKNWEIITDEGIGNRQKGYHPIQKQLAALSGTQCGFCSPGFVMSMFSLLESKGNSVSMHEVENSFGGNICRCTGYRPILDAMKSFANDNTFVMLPELQDIEDLSLNLCPRSLKSCENKSHDRFQTKLLYKNGSQWYWPESLEELFQVLENVQSSEEYMLVGGNTAHGVYRRSHYIKHFIDINNIPDLKRHSLDDQKLSLGANLSLTQAMDIFKQASSTAGFEYCQLIYEHFDLIANPPVRNVGTLAGNLAIKKAHLEFPSDVFLLFECLDATVVFKTSAEEQEVVSLEEYMKNKAKNIVAVAFELKAYPKEEFFFKSYKVMPRAQNAHAYVNAAFLLEVNPDSDIIKSARICFGGIRPDFVHLTQAESLLVGRSYSDEKVLSDLLSAASQNLQPNAVLPDPSPEYRTLLACALLYRFFLNVTPNDKVKPEFQSGREVLQRPLSSGSQDFKTIKKNYPITEPVPKVEGLFQCSGEAQYMNDVITARNTAYCAFVTATKVGASIQKIDASEALQLEGVLAFYAAKDIPGRNISFEKGMWLGKEDEELFCSDTVKFYDQPLGVIVATASDIANRAAMMVKVMYSNPAERILIDVDEVLKNNEHERLFVSLKSTGDGITLESVNDPILSCSGHFKIGSQYHFTMEPQTTVVVPTEDGFQVWSATQYMDHTQTVIALVLSINVNKVQLQVRRLGGAYGGKYSRGNRVACAAALAAYKLNRPIRFVQSIESMMNCNGKRWACQSEYSFDIGPKGKIVYLKNVYYEDAGCTLNESPATFEPPGSLKNCYDISSKNSKLEGHVVLTDAPSTTLCRAPGILGAMMENIMEHLAFEANIDPADARKVNLKSESRMAEFLPQFLEQTQYKERRKTIEDFNSKNRWRKQGLGLALMEYPIGFVGTYLATVAIYHYDGTVAIRHGSIDMGQGLNTKASQVAAFVLGVPLKFIKIEPSDTVDGANSVGTGGSIGSDVVCYAIRKACNTLNDRLKPIRDALLKDASWQDIIKKAHEKSVNLVANESFKKGDLENYATNGLALTEVEVDVLTGNLLITRVDIFEDTGESLNPLIDVGQVEGAFVMALGYWLTEQLIFDRQTGRLLTNNTWTYKTPGAKDIPIDFRIKLSQKYPNKAGFMRSKTASEPPLCLAISVIFAIQQAIQSARKDAGVEKKWISLGAPTTPEVIALSCGTDINSFILN